MDADLAPTRKQARRVDLTRGWGGISGQPMENKSVEGSTALAWLTERLEDGLLGRRWKGDPPPAPEKEAKALLAWSNLSPPVARFNLQMLLNLALKGNFEFWQCPQCNGTVLLAHGEILDSWVRPNQRDTDQIPLRYAEDQRCDHCRFYNVTEGVYDNGDKVQWIENPI